MLAFLCFERGQTRALKLRYRHACLCVWFSVAITLVGSKKFVLSCNVPCFFSGPLDDVVEKGLDLYEDVPAETYVAVFSGHREGKISCQIYLLSNYAAGSFFMAYLFALFCSPL